MNTLTVSVVIPTYNGTRYLAEAVQSALTQTCNISEIIIVDDGSVEDIPDILQRFPPRVTYVRQKNAGPAAARNHGVSIATGDVIAFLDDDDLWHPAKTAVQLQLMIENPHCALVYSYPQLIDENGNVIPNEAPAKFPSGDVYRDFLIKNRITTPSATLIKREIFKTIGLFDENRQYMCAEDYDLWLRIAKNYDVLFCPGTCTSYRVRSTGISKNIANAFSGYHYTLNKVITCHIENPKLPDSDFYAAVNTNLYNSLRLFAYRYYYGLNDRIKAKRLIRDALKMFPYCLEYFLKDILYLAYFSIPDTLFRFLRRAKQKLSAIAVSLEFNRKAA